ncbi:hypothetical protein [Actinomadura madurae]|uniref:hypothetical protein n=1 Tax=Actinomadura madurae TaxID=1993 RepID=UPI0027E35532|nr:hypothetical protein [Actinomadura madurae]
MAAAQPGGRVQRVEAAVAAHPDDVDADDAGRDARVADEVGAQAGAEEARGGDAAQVVDVGQAEARVVQAGPDRLRPHLQGVGLVLGEQVALGLGDAAAAGVPRREHEVAPLDRAVEEDGPDPGIGDVEDVEDLALGVGRLRGRGADAHDPGGTGR